MRGKKGFTLIELMVVILIVAVLAAVLVPLIRARIDAAKWSEARAACGNIASGVRAYWAEHQDGYSDGSYTDYPTLADVCLDIDLTGKYFTSVDYTLDVTDATADGIEFTITVDSKQTGNAPMSPTQIVFTQPLTGGATWSQTN